mgnify:CR=1 FL=1
MLLQKEGMPEEDELVLCTVSKVQFHSVFVVLDEFDKQGMIHISEVSPGRIRNIRDFVREGKKIVCKVLRIHQDRGHIDLSLRRVTETQRRQKIDEMKQQQKAEKILEYVARDLKIDSKKFFETVTKSIQKNHATLYEFFQSVVAGSASLKDLPFEDKILTALQEAISSRISEQSVMIEGTLKLQSYAPNGVEIVKESLQRAQDVDKEHVVIKYLGSGSFHVEITAKDYKIAEKLIKDTQEAAINCMTKHEGTATFVRIQE